MLNRGFGLLLVLTYANLISYLSYGFALLASFVIPACLESLLKKDPGQARMTERETYTSFFYLMAVIHPV